VFDRGVYIPQLDLWLDSTRKRDSSVISHAHSDHTGRHRRPVVTPNTLLLLREYLKNADPIVIPYGEPLETTTHSITLYPAGHCLGSAQTLVVSKSTGERLLYTGDIKTRTSPTNEPLETVRADTLVIESTYGHPGYVFPPQEQTLVTASRTLRAWLSRGERPVALGWRLGKAQELLHHLLSDDFEVIAEEGIYRAVEAYREAGILFPGKVSVFDGHWPDGTVALFPPGRSSQSLKEYRHQRTMELTGWAVSKTPHHWRRPADASLPFSDHADFNDLLAYVEAVKPSRVYTVYGFPELAAKLRSKGYPAVHLDGKGTPSGTGFQMRMV
jgi:Cft2 family RNA processing exonuclease